MKVQQFAAIPLDHIKWDTYDLILLASGFEDRSIFLLEQIPVSALHKCTTLGFSNDRDKLSRAVNDIAFAGRGLHPFVAASSTEYETKLQEVLLASARLAGVRPVKILVDYSVMTRAWYGYILTWLRYSGDITAADVHFVYAHGDYLDEFDQLRIEEIPAIQGFEGGCAASRRTIAFFGLGYDRYATLAAHEIIEPDNIICYLARDGVDDQNALRVLRENSEIIELSGSEPIFLPLGDVGKSIDELVLQFSKIPTGDEIIAVPMGPKTHVLATLMAAQKVPRVTCLHPIGSRKNPVQVKASGRVSCWAAQYR